MLRYTLLRLAIFVGCFAAVWALVYAGLLPRGLGESNGLWVLLLSLVISAPISFVALRKQRDAASENIVTRVDRAKVGFAKSASQEDHLLDSAEAPAAQPATRTTGGRARAHTPTTPTQG
ncbi:DUF4229 domain-containing protein [Streptomyces sp. NPDC002490]|uniref:DUF4229 domain-containing protein n=1 Tax=Streptomyces sp. NPDC002490 TaxID=3154416 RepID=UPI00332E8E03